METEEKRRSSPRRRPASQRPSAEPPKAPGRRPPERRKPPVSGKKQAAHGSAARKAPPRRHAAKHVPQHAAPNRRRRTSDTAKRKRPEIIYTPPKPFSRNRFLLRLGTATAVVLALTFVLSVFFKVRKVTVSGADLYTPYTVMEASGIKEGDNLLSIGKAGAYARIKVKLPYVESVRIGIKLPDTVNIGIVERDVVYAIQAQDDTWWMISGDGEVVEKTDSAKAGKRIKVTGVQLAAPIQGQPAVAAETAAPTPDPGDASDPSASAAPAEKPVTVTGEQRLKVALQVLQGLEKYGLVEQIASVDVGNPNSIVVMYGTRFEVRLGDSTQLDYKIKCLEQAVAQMTNYQSGVLDISFTTWEDMVGYTPFE